MTGITVELELEDGAFVRRMLRAGQSVEKFNRQVVNTQPQLRHMRKEVNASSKSFRQLAESNLAGFKSMQRVTVGAREFRRALRDMTIIMAGVSFAFHGIQRAANGTLGSIIRVNAEIERMNKLLQGMATSSDPVQEAGEKVDWLLKMAKDSPFSLNYLTDAFVKMRATGIEPMNGQLQALVDGIAAAGKSDEALKRASIAISQISGKGVLQMEELRQQLGEAIPRATELMARSMGVSYGQLVEDIGTGTVRGIKSLEALQRELERTYGGAAIRMMSTFTGQWNKLITVLQQRALDVGGDVGSGGFFDEVKRQLTELNILLETEFATNLAVAFGDFLASGTRFFRDVIDQAIRFRREIMAIGTAIGLYLGSRAMVGVASGVVGFFQHMRTQARQTNAELVLLHQNYKNFANSAGGVGLLAAVGGRVGLRRAMGVTNLLANVRKKAAATRAIFIGLTRTIGSFMPAVALLAPVLYTLATNFGLIGNRARAAWKEIEQFGATSRAQLETAGGVITQQERDVQRLEAQLVRLKKRLRDVRDGTYSGPQMPGVDAMNDPEAIKENIDAVRERLVALRQELGNVNERYEEMQEGFADFEVDRMVQRQRSALMNELNKFSGDYDRVMQQAAKDYEAALREAARTGSDPREAELEYQETLRKRQKVLWERQLDFLQDIKAEQRAILEENAADLDSNAARVAQGILDEVNAQELRIRRNLNETLRAGFGTPMSPDTRDYDALQERAQNALNDMKSQAAGLRAELNGASSEAAKLAYQLINNEMYGKSGARAEIDALRDSLLETQDEIDELNRKVMGRRRFESDLASERRRLQDRLFELENPGASNIEKIQARYESGYYAGLGDDNRDLADSFDEVREAIANMISEAQNARQALIAMGFGNDSTMNGFGHALRTSVLDTLGIPYGEKHDPLGDLSGSSNSNELPGSARQDRLFDSSQQMRSRYNLARYFRRLNSAETTIDQLTNSWHALVAAIARTDGISNLENYTEHFRRMFLEVEKAADEIYQLSGERTNFDIWPFLLSDFAGRGAPPGIGMTGDTRHFIDVTLEDLRDGLVGAGRELRRMLELIRSVGGSLAENLFSNPFLEKAESFSDSLSSIVDYLERITRLDFSSLRNVFNNISGGIGAVMANRSAVAGSDLFGNAQMGRSGLLASAKSFLGATETYNRDPIDALFNAANINIDPEKTAWCAAFVDAVLAVNNLPKLGSLRARDFLKYGNPIGADAAKPGDIAVFSRGRDGGHVGFFQGYDENGNVRIIGGNQGGASAGGGGVTETTIARERLLGIRRPDGFGTQDDPGLIAGVRNTVNNAIGMVRAGIENPRELPGFEAGRQQIIDYAEIASTALLNARVAFKEHAAALKNAREGIDQDIESLGDDLEGYGDKVMEVRRRIRAGEFGPDTDPESERYADLIKAAEEWQRKEEQVTRVKQRQQEGQRAINRLQEEAQQQLMDTNVQARALREGVNGLSEAYIRREAELNQQLARIRELHGQDTEAYRNAVQQKNQILRQFQNQEVMQFFAGVQRKVQAHESGINRMSSMSQAEVQQEIARINQMVNRFRGSEEQRVQIAALANQRIKQLREQAANASSGPLARTMEQWGNIGQNMEQAFVGWMDSGIDAIANFVATGKANFKQLAQSIIKDITKIALRFAMSRIFQGFGNKGGGGAAGGKGKQVPGGMGGFKGVAGKMGVGVAHTGGIIGKTNLRKMRVDPRVFAGAKRFHEGGMIGSNLKANEVPIIARKGEGVFTPEQMQALGKGGSRNNVSITTNVNVNSNGPSTPEQDAKLAKRVGDQVEKQVRSVVADEIMQQQRNGGVLSQSGRGRR